MDAGDAGDEPIGDAARQSPLHEAVAPVSAPTGDNIKALLKAGDQPGDVGRIVLQVAVHRHNDVAPGVVDAGHQSSGLADIATEVDDMHPPVGCCDLAEQLFCVVAGAVVNEDHLDRTIKAIEHRAQIGPQGSNVVGLVVDRDQDGYVDTLILRYRYVVDREAHRAIHDCRTEKDPAKQRGVEPAHAA